MPIPLIDSWVSVMALIGDLSPTAIPTAQWALPASVGIAVGEWIIKDADGP